MTDNQRFKEFQKSIRKSRFSQKTPIPFPTKVHLYVWDNRSDETKPKLIEFTMQPGFMVVEAGRMASSLAKAQFGYTCKEMEYTYTHHSRMKVFCASTGKQLKY